MNPLDSSLLWGLVRVIIALVIIVPAAVYATRWYGSRQAPSKHLRIQEAVSLGANRTLYVVQWKERRLLLGVTNHNITLLDEKLAEAVATEEGRG